MPEIIATLPQQVAGIDNEKQVIILILAAHRENENEESVPLTKSQAEAALANAKATLEITEGSEVLGTSTGLILPNVELKENESLTLTIDAHIVKQETQATSTESATEATLAESESATEATLAESKSAAEATPADSEDAAEITDAGGLE